MNRWLLVLPLAIALGSGPATAHGQGTADLVLLNGNIITVDSADRVVEALAVKADRILALGTTAEIRRLIGPNTRQLDLQGLSVTPGLLDAHAHFSSSAADRMFVLDLSYPRVKSIADVKDSVAARVRRAQPGQWIQGGGWDEGKLSDRRYITAADLDAVAPNHPVWLYHTMLHYGVANTAALRLANISAATQDPPRGTIDRRPDGTPSGVLKEEAMGLVTRLLPRVTAAQRQTAMKDLARAFNAEGMTGVKDPGIGPEQWQDYQRILAEDSLPLRVFVLWNVGPTVAEAERLIERVGSFTRPARSTRDDRLISGGVKLFMDGSGGARTAWLYDEWNRGRDSIDAGNRGYPANDPKVLHEQIRRFHAAGMHVSVHAIGDRAIDRVVDSYTEILAAKPVRGLRHGIIHANIPTDRALAAMATLQRTYDAGYPEVSPTFTWWIGDTYAGNFGARRSQRLNPLRSFVQRGIRWASASDYSVTPFPARYGMWASLVRQPVLGQYGLTPFGTQEAVDIRAALRSYTIWAARQMFLDSKIGSLEVGKYADVAVWDRDLYRAPPEEIRDLECQLTLLGGRVVYQRPGSRLAIRVRQPKTS